jgi:hypothetical protein
MRRLVELPLRGSAVVSLLLTLLLKPTFPLDSGSGPGMMIYLEPGSWNLELLRLYISLSEI